MRRFGSVRSVSVWLVLLGFFCGMLVPAVSVAKVHREIDTEGDPTDGLGYTDSGGSTGGIVDNGATSSSISGSSRETRIDQAEFSISSGRIVVQTFWRDGRIVFTILISKTIGFDAGGDK